MGGAHQAPLQLPWSASATCSQFCGGLALATPAASLSDLLQPLLPHKHCVACRALGGTHRSPWQQAHLPGPVPPGETKLTALLAPRL